MPLPIAITFAILIGWPTIKLLTTAFSRPLWREQKLLRDGLLREFGSQDQASSDWETRIIKEEFESGKGDLWNLLLPVVALGGGLIVIFVVVSKHAAALASRENADALHRAVLVGRYPREAGPAIDRLVLDWRFRKMRDRAFDLELLRFPIANALSILAFAPALGAYLLFRGVKTSTTRFGKTLIEASQSVLFVFSGRFPCF